MTNDMDMDMADRPPRLLIQISEPELKLLTLWAKFHGRPVTTYAGQILSAQIEANADTVFGLVATTARLEGITEDEVIERWLGDGSDDES